MRANYNPTVIYKDASIRDITNVPSVDFYVASPPCQSYSQANLRARTPCHLVSVAYEYIRYHRPTYFVVENVRHFYSSRSCTRFVEDIRSLGLYHVTKRILDAKNYGLPQSRPRIYIVGIMHPCDFRWPDPVLTPALKDFVDTSDKSRKWSQTLVTTRILERIPTDSIFIDTSFANTTTFPNSARICPCILASGRLYNVHMGRFANVTEYLALQGFASDFKRVVSTTQMKKQLGNSIAVTVLKHLFEAMLRSKVINYTLSK